MTVFAPRSTEDVMTAVQWASSEAAPLEIVGHGTKRGIGRPADTDHKLDLSRLTGVTLYEPEELVLSARAGTPLSEIETLLTDKGQELAFEPVDFIPLLGGLPGRGTIGGVLMANLSGPRRIKAGAARDHVLGVHAVSGRGEAFKSGGRVVKNVTGYDLSKMLAGSWGTLAVVTDVTFKVLPAAETETTLILRGLLDEQAVSAMAVALGSSAEVSGAAHLPETITRGLGGDVACASATLLRLEGFAVSVSARIEHLRSLFGATEGVDLVADAASRKLWEAVRDCHPYIDGSTRPVWRVSMAPTEAHKMVMALRMETAVDAWYDWGGGLVWLRMESDPEAELLRGLIRQFGGGHATLIRASVPWRLAVPVFEPQPRVLSALSNRLKQQFDPNAILNPGRMAQMG